jgi:hypothetical protein
VLSGAIAKKCEANEGISTKDNDRHDEGSDGSFHSTLDDSFDAVTSSDSLNQTSQSLSNDINSTPNIIPNAALTAAISSFHASPRSNMNPNDMISVDSTTVASSTFESMGKQTKQMKPYPKKTTAGFGWGTYASSAHMIYILTRLLFYKAVIGSLKSCPERQLRLRAGMSIERKEILEWISLTL